MSSNAFYGIAPMPQARPEQSPSALTPTVWKGIETFRTTLEQAIEAEHAAVAALLRETAADVAPLAENPSPPSAQDALGCALTPHPHPRTAPSRRTLTPHPHTALMPHLHVVPSRHAALRSQLPPRGTQHLVRHLAQGCLGGITSSRSCRSTHSRRQTRLRAVLGRRARLAESSSILRLRPLTTSSHPAPSHRALTLRPHTTPSHCIPSSRGSRTLVAHRAITAAMIVADRMPLTSKPVASG